MMFVWIVGGVVDPQNQGDVLVRRRCSDDHFLRSRFQMGAHVIAVGKDAGGFDNDIDAERSPRQPRGIFLIEYLDLPTVDL